MKYTCIASVCRPRTLIASWTFVSCVRGFLSPASLKMRAKSEPLKGRAVTPYIYLKTTNNKSIPTRDVFHTTITVYGSELASLTDTVASPYPKQKVKHNVRKSIPNKGMLL